MLGKGLLKRDDLVRPLVYRSAMTRDRAAKSFLSDLIEKVYNESAMTLALQAIAIEKASREEIEEARRLLDEMEERQ